MSVGARLRKHLEENGVAYETIHHRADVTAQEAARDTHTPPAEFAKTVFLAIDGGFAVAVLPADDFVSEEKLRLALGARGVELATEEEIREICPDCELGAAHPFGGLYGLPVYVSAELEQDETITFNAGTHEDAVRVAYRDFKRLAEPQVVPLARHD
jgi:Ala-tRNA(Pro) deacylase